MSHSTCRTCIRGRSPISTGCWASSRRVSNGSPPCLRAPLWTSSHRKSGNRPLTDVHIWTIGARSRPTQETPYKGAQNRRSRIPALNKRVLGPRAHNAPEVQRQSGRTFGTGYQARSIDLTAARTSIRPASGSAASSLDRAPISHYVRPIDEAQQAALRTLRRCGARGSDAGPAHNAAHDYQG